MFEPKRFGTDLRLLPALDGRHGSRDEGNDLMTRATAGRGVDLRDVDGAENLQQALLLRFLTPRGALAELGHPDYGSRLAELIGERNTEANRLRARLFVLEALATEPRVQAVEALAVTQSRRDPAQMDISMRLVPLDHDEALDLAFSFDVEGGTARGR